MGCPKGRRASRRFFAGVSIRHGDPSACVARATIVLKRIYIHTVGISLETKLTATLNKTNTIFLSDSVPASRIAMSANNHQAQVQRKSAQSTWSRARMGLRAHKADQDSRMGAFSTGKSLDG